MHAHQLSPQVATDSIGSLDAGHDLTAAVVLRNARARGDEQEHESTNQHRAPLQPRARVRRPDSRRDVDACAVWALQVFFAAGNTRV